MGSSPKSNLGYASKWLPLAFAAMTAAILSLVALIQSDPIMADVLRVRAGADGVLYATVRFEAPTDTGPVTTVEELPLPRDYEGDDTVPIWPGNEGESPRIGLFGYIEVTPPVVVTASGIAALLGLVVVMTVRGFGYVPGTGEPGQTDPELVAEDRGFYWRT